MSLRSLKNINNLLYFFNAKIVLYLFYVQTISFNFTAELITQVGIETNLTSKQQPLKNFPSRAFIYLKIQQILVFTYILPK